MALIGIKSLSPCFVRQRLFADVKRQQDLGDEVPDPAMSRVPRGPLMPHANDQCWRKLHRWRIKSEPEKIRQPFRQLARNECNMITLADSPADAEEDRNRHDYIS